jgi:hypothetical protein
MVVSPEILAPYPDTARAFSSAELDRLERRLDAVATALDSAFIIPGTGIRFGADALIGLVPGFGDVAALALSAYIVLEARRLGAPPDMLRRMVGNIAIDAAIGTVPLLGDAFDVFFKANKRNMALLRAHIADLRSRDAKLVSGAGARFDRRAR